MVCKGLVAARGEQEGSGKGQDRGGGEGALSSVLCDAGKELSVLETTVDKGQSTCFDVFSQICTDSESGGGFGPGSWVRSFREQTSSPKG